LKDLAFLIGARDDSMIPLRGMDFDVNGLDRKWHSLNYVIIIKIMCVVRTDLKILIKWGINHPRTSKVTTSIGLCRARRASLSL
jgi:hypothetical protein